MIRNLGALALLLAITTGLYWKLTLSGSYTWLENPDQALQVRPWLDFEARELHAGRIPLWDPYQWAGQSLIGQVQPGLANPLNWLLFAMPLRDGHIPIPTLHWYWVLIRWLAAAFCFWLCRDLGASWWASVLGGAVFAFLGFMAHAATPQFAMSAVWLPLVLLFFARAWRGERPAANAALCGAALGAQFLSGHHNVPIYTAVLLGILWLWRIRSRRILLAAATFAAVCGLVAAVQVLPTVEYGRVALRWSGAPQPQHWNDRIPYSVHAEYSLNAVSIPGMAIPGLTVHANPYVGVVALSLAVAAAFALRRRPEVRLLSAFALGGLAIALGRDTPVHRILYEVVPMVDKARYPAMCIVLFQAALAPLAALGLDYFRGNRAGRFTLAALGAVAALLLLAQGRLPGHPMWVGAATAVALAAMLRWLRAAPAAVLALVLAEAAAYPAPAILPRNRPNSYAGLIAAQSDIAGFLKQQPGWFRVKLEDADVPYNFGDWHGLEQYGGYVASMPEKTAASQGAETQAQIYGVRYVVARQAADPAFVQVFQSGSGLKVFFNPAAREPLWTIRSGPCAQPDRLSVTARTSTTASFDAEAGCAAVLAVGDPTFTGWRAWVDGKRVPILEVEGLVRGVKLSAGRHRIDFRYRPGSVYWGAALSLLGLLVTAFLTGTRRHSDRNHGVASPSPRR
jgi:hypothetical protein